MPLGTMEVLLVGAKGLENTDFFRKMDPYVVLTCRSQEQRSSIASGKGTEPDWNETFVFNVSGSTKELRLRIMDSDTVTSDDFVGEATINLEALYEEGCIAPTVYNVVKDQEYRGEIKVGLTYTPKMNSAQDFEEESYGGWKEYN